MSAGMSRRLLLGAIMMTVAATAPVMAEDQSAGEAAGAGQRASDWLTIPVCPECHRGSNGIHGDKSMLRITKKTELSLVADTLERIYG